MAAIAAHEHGASTALAGLSSEVAISSARLSPALARKIEALRGIPLFEGVAEADILRLAESALLRRFDRGRTIARGPCAECLVLVEGRAKTVMPRGASTGEFALGFFERGEMLGDWLPGGRGNESASETVALEPAAVLFLPRRGLEAVLERNGRVALRFLEAVALRLNRVMLLAVENSCLEVGDRLYRKLSELAETRGSVLPGGAIRIEHGLFQSELAASIGASREAVNRQLALWRQQGLVEAGRRWVLVTDPGGLSMAVSLAARGGGLPGHPR